MGYGRESKEHSVRDDLRPLARAAVRVAFPFLKKRSNFSFLVGRACRERNCMAGGDVKRRLDRGAWGSGTRFRLHSNVELLGS